MLGGSAFFVIYDILTKGTPYIIFLFYQQDQYLYLFTSFSDRNFRGADAKSLIVISIILPAYPVIQAYGHNFPLNKPLIDLFAFGILGMQSCLRLLFRSVWLHIIYLGWD